MTNLTYVESKPLNQELPEKTLAKLRTKFSFFSKKFTEKKQNVNEINYVANGIIYSLANLYLVQKYKNSCFINSSDRLNPLVGYFRNMYITHIGRAKYLNSSAKAIFDCIKSSTGVFVIPIAFASHANLLIYRKKDNTIEHFEPHGKYFQMSETNKSGMQVREKMRKIVNKINKMNAIDHIFDTPLTYTEPNDVCPTDIGPQIYQQQHKTNNEQLDRGLCQMWSIMVAELVLENPDLTTKQIITELLDYSHAVSYNTYPKPYGKSNKTETETEKMIRQLRESVNFVPSEPGKPLSNMILGFTIYLESELDDYIKLIFLETEYNIKTLDQFFRVYNESNLTEKLLLMLYFVQFQTMKLDVADLINEIPTNLDSKEDIETYKHSLEQGIEIANTQLNKLTPIYDKLSSELEILRPEYNKLKKSFTQSVLRKTGLNDKTNQYAKFNEMHKELIKLQHKIVSYKYTINENTILLTSIGVIQMNEPFSNKDNKLIKKNTTRKKSPKLSSKKGGKETNKYRK